MKELSLAIKFLWREIRYGEWYVVFLALFLSIAAVTTLHFYVDRLTRGLDQKNTSLLGGDLVISSSRPLPAAWIKKANTDNLRYAEIWSYPTMVSLHEKMQLVNVQAVSANYPLLSKPSTPAKQQAWIDNRLLITLNIKLQDSIRIGASQFIIAKILTPDNGMLNIGWNIAPTVMLNLSDIPATQTVLPGSRVDYRLLLAGKEQQIKAFKTWIAPQLAADQRIIDKNNQPTALKNILLRANQYFQLILLICLTMSGVVIALSIQQYLNKHYQVVALWRSLGAKKKQIVNIFLIQLLIISLSAGLLGVLTGFATQSVLVHLFSNYLNFPLPASSWQPAWVGFAVSVLLLLSFSYPIITQLPNVPALYIWRREAIMNNKYRAGYLLFAIISLLIILMLSMGVSTLALLYMHGLLLAIIIMYVLSYFLLRGLSYLANAITGTWRRGISQLVQYSQITSLQIIGFSLILISILILQAIKHDLLANWQKTLPENTPNFFAFNIAPTDLDSLKSQLELNHVTAEAFYPIIRARLTTLNKQPIMQSVPVESRQNNALHRELNISWMWQYPSDNQITSGNVWATADRGNPLISIEEDLAKNLHIKIGDELGFQMGDKAFTGKVSNLRSLQWTSFHPNFFIIFTPGSIDSDAVTYITSFYLPTNKRQLIADLQTSFPNITVIDVSSLLQQVQEIVNKLSQAMQYLFLFALGLAVLILIASLQATMDERKKTYGLMRILGASQTYITKSIVVEFACLMVVILLMSFTLSYAIAYLLLKYAFPVI